MSPRKFDRPNQNPPGPEVLRQLLRAAGLVTAAGQGRSQRYALTAEGRTGLRTASSTVAAIEQRMIATLSRRARARPARTNVLGEHDQPRPRATERRRRIHPGRPWQVFRTQAAKD